MRYVRCGELEVSCIGLGTRTFGGAKYRAGKWQDTLDYALECGINLMDTSPNYQKGHSEEMLGRMLKGKRRRVLLSTKVGTHGSDTLLTPAAVRRTLHESMKRLQTDYIDILFVHYPDPRVEYDEIAGTLQSLKQEGSIRCWGLSNFDCRELNRWPMSEPPGFLQIPYSLLQRDRYDEVSGFMARQGIVPVAYTPLAMGLLALPPEKISAAAGYPSMLYSLLSSEGKDAFSRLHQAAAEHKLSSAAMALAWSLNDGKNVVLTGLGSREHIDQAIKGLEAAGESFIRYLPPIPQPVLPIKAEVGKVLKIGDGETLVQLKIADLGAQVPLWIDGPAAVGDELKVDGLTGKLISPG